MIFFIKYFLECTSNLFSLNIHKFSSLLSHHCGFFSDASQKFKIGQEKVKLNTRFSIEKNLSHTKKTFKIFNLKIYELKLLKMHIVLEQVYIVSCKLLVSELRYDYNMSVSPIMSEYK